MAQIPVTVFTVFYLCLLWTPCGTGIKCYGCFTYGEKRELCNTRKNITKCTSEYTSCVAYIGKLRSNGGEIGLRDCTYSVTCKEIGKWYDTHDIGQCMVCHTDMCNGEILNFKDQNKVRADNRHQERREERREERRKDPGDDGRNYDRENPPDNDDEEDEAAEIHAPLVLIIVSVISSNLLKLCG